MRIKKIALSSTIIALMVLMIPSAFACVPGKVTGGGHGKVGERVRTPAGSFGFNVMHTKKGLKGELQFVDHVNGIKVHAHDIDVLNVWEDLPGNKPWPLRKAEFWGPCTVDFGDGKVDGYGFYVYVEDNGEPGVNDRFYIWVDDCPGLPPPPEPVLEAGSKTESMLVGNIQIHKPMPGT